LGPDLDYFAIPYVPYHDLYGVVTYTNEQYGGSRTAEAGFFVSPGNITAFAKATTTPTEEFDLELGDGTVIEGPFHVNMDIYAQVAVQPPPFTSTMLF